MPSNMFFFNHRQKEEELHDSTSRKNVYEARFTIELAHYLLAQGYKTSQITILTTYSGQLVEINRQIRMHMNGDLREIGVFVVDDFQGEENDIIILSFVRSNDRNSIGFLQIENRVNVALSRAKMGLYCFGNFESFCRTSDLWMKIVEKAKLQRSFADKFDFVCEYHSDTKFSVRQPGDFPIFLASRCTKLCNTVMKCSHVCSKLCHKQDRGHYAYKCTAKCNKVCWSGHLSCTKSCHSDACEFCNELIMVHGVCGHEVEIKCGHSRNVRHILAACKSQCNNTCSSNHRCTLKCHYNSGNCESCKALITVDGKCGHKVKIACGLSEDVEKILSECTSVCGARLKCGHMCEGSCGSCKQGRFHVKCNKKSAKICGNKCTKTCSNDCASCLPKNRNTSDERNVSHNSFAISHVPDDVQRTYVRLYNEITHGVSHATERRSKILDYLIGLKSVIVNLSEARKFQIELNQMVCVGKLQNRFAAALQFLENLQSTDDEQGFFDLGQEIYMLFTVTEAVNQIIQYFFKALFFPSTEIDADTVAQLKPIFDGIPDMGPCSLKTSHRFYNRFKQTFQQIKAWNCVIS